MKANTLPPTPDNPTGYEWFGTTKGKEEPTRQRYLRMGSVTWPMDWEPGCWRIEETSTTPTSRTFGCFVTTIETAWPIRNVRCCMALAFGSVFSGMTCMGCA